MKVAAKLSTGFLLVVLLIWVAVFFAQNTYNRMQGEFAAVEEEIIPGVIAMSKMEILANQIAYETVAYINTGREENKQAVILAAEQLEALGQQYLAYEISEGPEEREMAEILVTGTDAFASSAVMLVRFRESGLVSDEVLLETAVYPLFPPMLQLFEDNKASTMEKLAVAEAAARSAYTSGVYILLLAAGLVTALAAAVALFISRSITRPLQALHRGTEIIGRGDLNYRVGTRAKDEIGQLSRAFDRMTGNLKNSTASIEDLNKEIADREQVEEALQTEKNKLQSVIGAMEDDLSIQDKDFNIIYQNKPSRISYGGDHIGEKCYRAYEGRDKICHGCPVKKAYKDSKSHTVERSHALPSGEVAFFENTANPIRDAGGKIVSCLEIGRDITERKQTEGKIRQQNEFLNTVLNSLSYPFYVLDVNDYTVKMSNQAAKAEGLPDATTCYSLIYKADKPCGSKEQTCPLEEVKKTKKAVVVEHTHYDGNGGARSIEIHGHPIFDAEGNVVQMIEYSLDITDRKRVEDELQESQRFSSTLLQNSPNPILVLDPDTSVRYVNPAFEKLTGFTLVDTLGVKAPHPWWPEELREEISAGLEKAMALGGKVGEQVFQKKNGERFWTALNSVEVKHGSKQPYFLLNLLDITEAKRMEKALRDSEEKWHSLVENAPDIIMLIDRDRTIQFINHVVAGLDVKDIIGRSIYDYIQPDSHDITRETVDRVFETGESGYYEIEGVGPDGRISWYGTSVRSIKIDGEVVSIIQMSSDITEAKRAEEQLRESEGRYRNLFENTHDMIQSVDPDGHFLFANRAWLETMGYAEAELPGLNLFQLISPESLPHCQEMFARVMEGESVNNTQATFVAKDGRLVLVEGNATGRYVGGKLLSTQGIFRDITERKQTEEVLKQKMEELRIAYQKLKELDKMKDNFLSTVSHELRTPLTSIKSFSEILLAYDEDRETQKEFLNIIKEESDRLTRLINDFLDLSKIESGRMQWETVELSVAEVIKTAINATQALAAKTKLKVKVTVSPNLPTVTSDKDRLVQVVTNLLSNAIKFTPEGGRIEVKARMHKSDKSKEKSDAVVVSVTDSGIGIDAKDYDSIFEKFKQVGDTLIDKPKGTGLGLPISKEIIEHFRGRLWVESQLGKGSTFFFTLPLAHGAGR